MNIRKEGFPFIAIATALFGLFFLTGKLVLRLLGSHTGALRHLVLPGPGPDSA